MFNIQLGSIYTAHNNNSVGLVTWVGVDEYEYIEFIYDKTHQRLNFYRFYSQNNLEHLWGNEPLQPCSEELKRQRSAIMLELIHRKFDWRHFQRLWEELDRYTETKPLIFQVGQVYTYKSKTFLVTGLESPTIPFLSYSPSYRQGRVIEDYKLKALSLATEDKAKAFLTQSKQWLEKDIKWRQEYLGIINKSLEDLSNAK